MAALLASTWAVSLSICVCLYMLSFRMRGCLLAEGKAWWKKAAALETFSVVQATNKPQNHEGAGVATAAQWQPLPILSSTEPLSTAYSVRLNAQLRSLGGLDGTGNGAAVHSSATGCQLTRSSSLNLNLNHSGASATAFQPTAPYDGASTGNSAALLAGNHAQQAAVTAVAARYCLQGHNQNSKDTAGRVTAGDAGDESAMHDAALQRCRNGAAGSGLGVQNLLPGMHGISSTRIHPLSLTGAVCNSLRQHVEPSEGQSLQQQYLQQQQQAAGASVGATAVRNTHLGAMVGLSQDPGMPAYAHTLAVSGVGHPGQHGWVQAGGVPWTAPAGATF